MKPAILTAAALAALSLAAARPARADIVADWWDYAGKIGGPLTGAAQTPEQSRAVTRAALAMFEAVEAIHRRHEKYLRFSPRAPAAPPAAPPAPAASPLLPTPL